MGWADNLSRKMSEWLRIGAAKPDTSDQPDLKDVFVAAPPRLAAPIRQAGGDPDRVVRWFECDAGEVFRFATTGETAVEGWRSLRGCFESTGCWPVILGANESIERLSDALFEPDAPSVADILERARRTNLEEWQSTIQRRNGELDPEYARPYAGEWPDDLDIESVSQFTGPRNVVAGRPLKRVWIGFLPIRHASEAAAVMRFGDWNAVPPPEVHVALHDRWAREYGAEIVTFKEDVLEFQVSRPPQTRDAAMKLAELQYDYCPDIVDQGVGSIEALAAGLLNGRIWYFWWD